MSRRVGLHVLYSPFPPFDPQIHLSILNLPAAPSTSRIDRGLEAPIPDDGLVHELHLSAEHIKSYIEPSLLVRG